MSVALSPSHCAGQAGNQKAGAYGRTLGPGANEHNTISSLKAGRGLLPFRILHQRLLCTKQMLNVQPQTACKDKVRQRRLEGGDRVVICRAASFLMSYEDRFQGSRMVLRKARGDESSRLGTGGAALWGKWQQDENPAQRARGTNKGPVSLPCFSESLKMAAYSWWLW